MTTEQATHLLQLYATEPSLDDAAAHLGLSRRTLLRWVRRLREAGWDVPERTGRPGHVPPPPDGEVTP